MLIHIDKIRNRCTLSYLILLVLHFLNALKHLLKIVLLRNISKKIPKLQLNIKTIIFNIRYAKQIKGSQIYDIGQLTSVDTSDLNTQTPVYRTNLIHSDMLLLKHQLICYFSKETIKKFIMIQIFSQFYVNYISLIFPLFLL